MMMIVAPSRPRPTVNMPATPPVRNATFSAPGSTRTGRSGGADVAPHRETHADEPGEAGHEAAGEEGERAEGARLPTKRLTAALDPSAC